MKNIGTKAEVVEYEKDKVASFMKELQAITKKYKIKGIFTGTRKQTPKFTDENASVCAAFTGGFGIDDLSKFEATSLLESINESKEATFGKIKDIAQGKEEENSDHLDALAYLLHEAIEQAKREAESRQSERKKGRFQHTIEKIGRIFGK